MESKSICIIPARMGSSRFPGKPLEKINGKEMIAHCYKNAEDAHCFDQIYIATPDQQIVNFCEKNNLSVVLTGSHHERCTSRTLEAVNKIEENKTLNFSKIVMLQGDEPLINGEMINKCNEAINKHRIVNLATEINDNSELDDINEVKVVFSKSKKALYFSRSKIPNTKDNLSLKAYKQVCAIGFTKESLNKFEDLEPTQLEIFESIDMNRLIENDIDVHIVLVEGNIASVDTKEDLIKVENILNNE
tara:strand:+ start:535 stop:1275 length:741 start_codon:yes stop_codon:yes gene_type:complete